MANTTADKLRAALASKADILGAIDEMGGSFASDEDRQKLAKFGDAVRSIPTGGADLVDSLDADLPDSIKDGFLRIVKAPLKDEDGQDVTDVSGETLYSYSLYIWQTDEANPDGHFVAAHGAYDAKTVFFSDNLLSTYAIGNYTLVDGQVTIPAKGKNLEQLFKAIYQKEDHDNLQKTAPSVTSNAAITWKEVGSAATSKNVTITFKDGVYKYGPTPGCQPAENGYYFDGTAQSSATKSISSGAFDSRKKVTVGLKVKYDAATANPKSNTGVEYPSQAFGAGTTLQISPEVFGCYMPLYYGFKTDADALDDPTAITATQIKALGHAITEKVAYDGSVGAANAAFLTKLVATAPFQQLFYAVPECFTKQLTDVVDKNGLPLTVKETSTISVPFGDMSKNYTVYYVALDALYGTLDLTLTWN